MRRLLCFVGWHSPVYRKSKFIAMGWSITCTHCGATKRPT